MSYPRPFANRTYFADIIPDPTNTKDLVPIRRFPTDVFTGDEKISDPPLQSENSPVDPVDDRVIASGLRRTSDIEQSMCESNPLTTVLLRCIISIQPTIAPIQARNAVHILFKQILFQESLYLIFYPLLTIHCTAGVTSVRISSS